MNKLQIPDETNITDTAIDEKKDSNNMNIYISGPMNGHPGLNFMAFHAAEKTIRDMGHNPLNPAKHPSGLSYKEYIMLDLEIIAIAADGIALLPGWQKSPGAREELRLALSLNLEVYLL